MSAVRFTLPAIALLAAGVPALLAPAQAASSASSAVSDSIGALSGSVSTSFEKSSNSSSRRDVAAGDYRIVDVAAVDGRPGLLRLRLQAVEADAADVAAGDGFWLLLPQQAFDNGRLAAGQIVSALARPYGLEFARADTRQAFFLVLADTWYRELQSNPVL